MASTGSIFNFNSSPVEVRREPGRRDEKMVMPNSLFSVENKAFIFTKPSDGVSFVSGKPIEIGRTSDADTKKSSSSSFPTTKKVCATLAPVFSNNASTTSLFSTPNGDENSLSSFDFSFKPSPSQQASYRRAQLLVPARSLRTRGTASPSPTASPAPSPSPTPNRVKAAGPNTTPVPRPSETKVALATHPKSESDNDSERESDSDSNSEPPTEPVSNSGPPPKRMALHLRRQPQIQAKTERAPQASRQGGVSESQDSYEDSTSEEGASEAEHAVPPTQDSEDESNEGDESESDGSVDEHPSRHLANSVHNPVVNTQRLPVAEKQTSTTSQKVKDALRDIETARRMKKANKTVIPAVREKNEAEMLRGHLELLDRPKDLDYQNEITHTPIFTRPVLDYATSVFGNRGKEGQPIRQWGLLGGDTTFASSQDDQPKQDPRIFWNISAPSSVFICGSQGSGKSHTLSCFLENSLIKSAANQLVSPLTAIVFNYDTFSSDTGGSACEAAWLAGSKGLSVRVLCPPTNIVTMRRLYKRFANIQVQELRLSQSDFNTKRMKDLMGVTATGDGMPLYMSVVERVLRDLRLAQQQNGGGFNYTAFKKMIENEGLKPEQLVGLRQRLDILESFMLNEHAQAYDMFEKQRKSGGRPRSQKVGQPTDWTPKPGQLTIVDLSCPCVTAEAACSLFNICLSLFLEQSSNVGRLVVLDEAHKYMGASTEAENFTNALLRTIREQRHVGARVLISTQEPTISPKLMDLCNVTIVHRFTSPDWLNALKKHLAGVSSAANLLSRVEAMAENDAVYSDEAAEAEHKRKMVEEYRGVRGVAIASKDPALEVFSKIINLRVGEALLFSPSAIVGVQKGEEGRTSVKKLVHGVLKVRVRKRVTGDGGASIMA